MTTTEVEDRWLARAWEIFHTSAHHLRECHEAGGAADSGTRLFPGYLGEEYPADGGLLCLGLAGGSERERPHDLGRLRSRYDIAEDWTRAGRPPAVDPTRALQFLAEWRTTYLAELPRWTWWKQHFKYIIERCIEIDVPKIAIGNVAACHMSQANQGNKLAKLCDRNAHPLAGLLEILRPKVILATGMELEKGRDLVPTSWPGLVLAWPAARGGASDSDRSKIARQAKAAL